MLWIITNVGRPDSDADRERLRPSHLEYLHTKEDILVLSGPMQNDDATKVHGSVFLVSTKDRAEAQAFSDNEPFTKGGLFQSTTLTRMRKGHWHPGSMKD